MVAPAGGAGDRHRRRSQAPLYGPTSRHQGPARPLQCPLPAIRRVSSRGARKPVAKPPARQVRLWLHWVVGAFPMPKVSVVLRNAPGHDPVSCTRAGGVKLSARSLTADQLGGASSLLLAVRPAPPRELRAACRPVRPTSCQQASIPGGRRCKRCDMELSNFVASQTLKRSAHSAWGS